MEVRFEDHGGFQRAAALAAVGGGALAAVAPQLAAVPAAVAGSAFALAFASGLTADARRRRLGAAIACAVAAGAWLIAPNDWLLPAAGALLGLAFALARDDEAAQSGGAHPSRWVVALSALLGAGTVLLASAALVPLMGALASAVPGWVASGASGAAFGLWASLAAAPLHVAVGGDEVESRLASLRASLGPDLRPLAERAAAARRGATDELPGGARADLRTLLDSLALAALDLAARAADLGRSAPAALEEDLQRRCAQLTQSAASAADPAAQKSYLRAADALQGQLDHFRRVRLARERALARLHEDVANLERARFSLTLLRGADAVRGAVELDLLSDRLQQGAMVFEAEEQLSSDPCPTSGIPIATSDSAPSAGSRSTISSR